MTGAVPRPALTSANAPVDADRPPRSTPPAVTPSCLNRARLATLEAAARVIVPGAFDPRSPVDLMAECRRRISALPEHLRSDFGLALDVLGHPLVNLILERRWRRFRDLSAEARHRTLDRLRDHPIPALRTVYQAIRRAVIASYYATPQAQTGIGYPGPYFQRGPIVEWEGPLRGTATREEPVARGEHPAVPPPPPPPVADRSRELTTDRLTADAVIIGSGAGGAVAAARLAGAGLDVVVLERGELVAPAEMTEDEGAATARMYADVGARATDDLAVTMLQGETVGGGTTVNWLLMLRTPDDVLEEWTRDHGAEGIDPAAMRAVFERIERETHTFPVPDDAHSMNNRLLRDGARALGWRAATGANNALGCVRAGFCGMGCRYGARQGAMTVYLPIAERAGARILAGAAADRIEVLKDTSAFPKKRVHARLTAGRHREITIESPIVVVAGGAVRTPLLLQQSGLDGPALGRFLRLHPTTAVIGVHDHDVHSSSGVPQSIVVDEHRRDGPGGHGFWLECPPVHPVLAAIAVPGFGAAHRALIEQSKRHAVIIALTRDGGGRAGSHGSVRLGRSGRPRIRYTLRREERSLLARATEAAARVQLAAGAREVVTLHSRPHVARDEPALRAIRSLPFRPNMVGVFSAHVNGTCRMGTDPRRAACSPAGELAAARGVYVLDGSLLPTAPGVNPQETIMALSSVLAEHLAERFGALRAGV